MTSMIVDELGRIAMSPFLTATLTRAAEYASAQAHRQVTLEHLLLALAEDPEASVVLKSSNVDIARLTADVSDHLGQAVEHEDPAESGPVTVSHDLRRILEAAAAAAHQGRRREINGAIVLAAIVGDGKSTAAHFLRNQGLTFEEAIRALQRANTPSAPAPARPPEPSAAFAASEEEHAAARERIEPRAGGDFARAATPERESMSHASEPEPAQHHEPPPETRFEPPAEQLDPPRDAVPEAQPNPPPTPQPAARDVAPPRPAPAPSWAPPPSEPPPPPARPSPAPRMMPPQPRAAHDAALCRSSPTRAVRGASRAPAGARCRAASRAARTPSQRALARAPRPNAPRARATPAWSPSRRRPPQRLRRVHGLLAYD